jgi:quercetin dioxygenase-like cupin family protein
METLPRGGGGIKPFPYVRCKKLFALEKGANSPMRFALDFDPSSVLTWRMINRRILLTGAGALVAHGILAWAQAQGGNKVVFRHDLPDLDLKDWSVTAVEVSYAPGESSPAHSHPGITIVYVLEGEICSKVGDEPETTFTPGQMFLETPDQLHGVSRNASAKPAKFLVILLAPKDKPLTKPA